MGGPIPCLGYASRSEAVAALRSEGLTSRQIAERIGIAVKTVTALEGSMARRDRTEPREAHIPGWNTIAIDDDTQRALRPHAARRGLTVAQLARDLLVVLANDALVDALLDDDVARVAR